MCLYPPLTQTYFLSMALTKEQSKGVDYVFGRNASENYQDDWNLQNGEHWSGLAQSLSDRGTNWAALVAANPYQNLNYRQSWWQKALSHLGFRTGYDKALEQAQIQSNEYISGLAQMAREDDYNSPEAEAARMRAAGMNPDLLGTEGVNPAASMPEDNSVMSPDTFAADDVGQVVGFVGQAVTMAFGLVQNIQAMKQASNAVKLGNVQVAKDISDLSMDVITRFVGSDRLGKDGTGKWIDKLADETVDDSYGLGVAKKLGFRGSMRRKFAQNFMSSLQSLAGQNEIFGMSGEKVDNQVKYYRRATSRFYNPSDSHAMAIVNESLQSLTDDVLELKQESAVTSATGEVVEARNNLNYQEQLENLGVPGEKADYENSELMNNQFRQNLDTIINKHMNDMIQGLERAARDGDELSQALVYALTMYRLIHASGADQALKAVGSFVGNAVDAFF